MRTMDIIMCIVLLALRLGGFCTRQKPHMERLRSFCSKRLFEVMGDAVRIDEMAIHTLSHITRSNAVLTMGINKRVALDRLSTVTKSCVAQLLIVGNNRSLNMEVATNNTIHQHWNTTMFSRLTYKTGKIVVECGTRIGVTIRLCLLVVMTELDDDIITGLYKRHHLFPSTLVNETLGGAAIDGMVINHDMIVKIALQSHCPTSFLLTTGDVLVGSGRVTYNEDGCGPIGHSSRQTADNYEDKGQTLEPTHQL